MKCSLSVSSVDVSESDKVSDSEDSFKHLFMSKSIEC